MAVAQTQPQRQQKVSIPTQVQGMTFSQSLEGHLQGLDFFLQKLLGNIQWAICDEGKTAFHYDHSFLFSSSESFSQLCLEVTAAYGEISQKSSVIALKNQNGHLDAKLKRQLIEEDYTSLLLIPLLDEEGYLGTMCIGQPHKQDDWSEEALTTLKAIAQQVITILRQKEQLERAQQQAQQQQLLQSLYHCFNTQGSDDLPWERILSLIGEYFQVEQVILLRFLENHQVIVEEEWRINRDIHPWQAIENFESDCTLNSYQYTHCTLEIDRNACSKSNVALSVSLKSRGKCFGRLILQSLNPHHRFSCNDVRFLEEIGDIIAIFGFYNLFNQTLTQLEDKNSAKGEFLSYMTHELRTPLSGILGFARMLNKELYGKLNAKQKEYVGGIVTSGEHLLSLVNDFLDFSKLEAQKEELVLEPMVVEELCQSVFAIVQSKAREQEIELILEIADSVDIFTADQRRIKQILLNLLSNAIKFTAQGSVTLKVTRDHSTLFFSVIDTGIGIKKEDQAKLFEPFEQIKNKLSHKHQGTGLGLTISRQLAQLHGGDLTFTSQEGQGSCFTLLLPQKPMKD